MSLMQFRIDSPTWASFIVFAIMLEQWLILIKIIMICNQDLGDVSYILDILLCYNHWMCTCAIIQWVIYGRIKLKKYLFLAA